jgi:hypothetical protein
MVDRSRTIEPDGRRRHVRKGGGVRVYLERPWFSSGEGELLGVVLANGPESPANDLVQPYVTHRGRDPVFQSSATFNPAERIHFLSDAFQANLRLAIDCGW